MTRYTRFAGVHILNVQNMNILSKLCQQKNRFSQAVAQTKIPLTGPLAGNPYFGISGL